ncbi:MAG: protocatechuate 3,4-dioxygenase subunit alpha [Thermoleophilia bacterium]|nr:protocatechuate 3,4-dioxygenase subunit alpha [Gaiellaceae bacterium]MDW8338579.1 protocatechuate 3,4-dioxygenase subunit alpha [Thermoleophilia bacterium]
MTALPLTPSQTVGPYLRIGLIGGPIGSRLIDESDPRAIRIHGLLLDGAGEPVLDGLIEIWQANAAGRYAHPADDRDELPLEEGFWGFGRSETADGGRFELLTVKPGRVPWIDGRPQAPHLLVSVLARGLLRRLATRMYFPDEEEANAEDPVLSALTPRERATLLARPDGRDLRFDIVLQGPRQTTFFAL